MIRWRHSPPLSKKGTHVHVEGSLRSREYNKAGLKHRVWDVRLTSVLTIDAASPPMQTPPQPPSSRLRLPPRNGAIHDRFLLHTFPRAGRNSSYTTFRRFVSLRSRIGDAVHPGC